MSKIDIVIPVYDEPNDFYYIKRCVESILKYDTTLLNKIILSDDGEGRLKDLFDDERIMVVRSGERKYFSGNTNYGVEFVTTEYFITMNSDCMITKFSPDWIDEFYRNRREDYGIISSISCIEEDGCSTYTHGLEDGCHGPIAWFIKTEFWRKMGGLRADGKYIHWHSDVEFIDRVKKTGYKTGLLHIYIQHEGGKSTPKEIEHTHIDNSDRII